MAANWGPTASSWRGSSGSIRMSRCGGRRRGGHVAHLLEEGVDARGRGLGLGGHPEGRLAGVVVVAADAAGNGCILLADVSHPAGLIVAGQFPNPVGIADVTMTTTHKTLRGPRGGMILCQEEFAKKLNSNIFPGIQGGPLMHVIAAKAVAFKEALAPEFKDYAAQVVKNAQALAAELVSRGHNLVSGGTDNHLMLVDFSGSDLTGKVAEETLEKAGITVNKNAVPFDTRSPFVTSGIRIGTPASTTRGLKEDEMRQIGAWIDEALQNIENDAVLERIRGEIRELCVQFPLYAHRLV